ncbi:DnaJ domain-containing protein [Microbispora amethystogenes]|uniref:DnaJ domain-containing protein n=1 Tax=Microbispora amethystogenes TaxID=1427754 RepID=UPI003402E844
MFSRKYLGYCRGYRDKQPCGKQVWWTKTEGNNAHFAVNLRPDPEGNTAVWCDTAGVLRSRRITEQRPATFERRMMPHVATCTGAPRPKRSAPRPPRVGGRPAAREFYDRLGVARTATPEEIKRAFRRLSRQLHPDLHPGDAEAAERFKAVAQAYDCLSDPAKRHIYDVTGRPPRPGR